MTDEKELNSQYRKAKRKFDKKLSNLFREDNLKLGPSILLGTLKRPIVDRPLFLDSDGNEACVRFSTAEAKRGAEFLAHQYEETSDPIAALVAFWFSLKHEIPVPPAVSEWLLNGLQTYACDFANTTLDKALGLNAKRGKGKALADAQKSSSLQQLMCEIRECREMYRAPIKDAAEMVSAKAKKKSICYPYSAGTLARYYKGEHGQRQRNAEFILPPYTAEEKKQYMQTFPNEIIIKYDKLSWE